MSDPVYQLTVAGVEQPVKIGTLQLSKGGLRTQGRLTCQIDSEDGSFEAAVGDPVVFSENATPIFAGVVMAPGVRAMTGEGLATTTTIEVADLHAYIDRRVVNVDIAAGNLKAALTTLVAYLAGFGITLASGQDDGPDLPRFVFSFTTLREALNTLAEHTNRPYRISPAGEFSMLAPASVAAPFDVDDDTALVGDITLEPDTDGPRPANIVHVLGGQGQQTVTDEFTGDGSEDEFTLNYTLAGHIGYVTINGTVPEGLGDAGSGAVWEWSTTGGVTTITRTLGAPGHGDTISITYTAQLPKLVTATTDPAPDPEDVKEVILRYPNQYAVDVLEGLAAAAVERLSATRKKVRYQTYLSGLEPGMTQTITRSDRGLSGTFLILGVEGHNAPDEQAILWTVTLVSGDSLVEDWQESDFWRGGTDGASSTGGGVVAVTTVTAGGVGGAGTSGTLARWTASNTLGNSSGVVNADVAAAAAIDWSKINKTGSSLADLATRSAAALSSGNLAYARLPSGSGTWTGNPTISGTLAASNIGSHLVPSTGDSFDLGSASNLWRSSYISTMNALVFAQTTQTLFGGYSTIGIDAGDFAAAVASGATTINFGKTMTPGHWVLVRAHDTSGTIRAEYLLVGTLVSGTTYNVTRDLASAHSPDPAWAAGTPFLVLGASGAGRIDMIAADGKPRIVWTQQGSAYNTQDERVVIGNLNTYYGYASDIYGAAMGDESGENLTIEPTNGIRVRDGSTVYAQLASGVFRVGASGGNRVEFDGTHVTVESADLLIDSDGIQVGGTGTISAFVSGAAYRFRRPAAYPATTGDIFGMYATNNEGFTYQHRVRVENIQRPATTSQDMIAEVALRAQGWVGGGTAAAATQAQILLQSAHAAQAGTGVATSAQITADATILSGVLRVAAGSAGAPSLSFDSDRDTGFLLHHAAPGFLGVSINGTVVQRWDSNGDLHPITDNTMRVGVPTFRYSLIRGVTITSGDLEFENGFVFTEAEKVGIDEPGIALLAPDGELVAFFGRAQCRAKGLPGAADVDALPFVPTTSSERAEMDLHPEQRVKGHRADGAPIFKTAADVRPLPRRTDGRTNLQRTR